jgi:hypothetical protein
MCILFCYIKVKLYRWLFPQTSYDEFQMQVVQVTEGRMASVVIPTDVTSHSSHHANIIVSWGMVGAPSSWACTLRGDDSKIQCHSYIDLSLHIDVDQPVRCTLAAVVVSRIISYLLL